MKRTTIGSLDVTLAGGSDGDGGGDGPLVVLLHGFGAPGDDLVPLWRVVRAPAGARFLFPAAPLSLEAEGMPGARAWWRINLDALQRGGRRDTNEVPPGLVAARSAVEGVLRHVEEAWRVPPSRIVLGGFSQGAMLSLDVALRRPAPLAGVALLSGSIIAGDEWRALLPPSPPRPAAAVFQSHGAADPLLPFSTAEALRDLMGAAGLDVTWSPFRGAHELPPGVLDGLGEFLVRVLA